ncbi:MAG: hypothetical protein ACI9BO_002225 [Zhongshania sp.]|jgi:hypothetical protein
MARSQSNRFYIPMLGDIALFVTSGIAANASFGILPVIALGFGLVFLYIGFTYRSPHSATIESKIILYVGSFATHKITV